MNELQDDLMAELEDLEQEEIDEQLLDIKAPVTDDLPSVPTQEPAKPKSECSTFYTAWHVLDPDIMVTN